MKRLLRLFLVVVGLVLPASVFAAVPAYADFYPNRYLIMSYHSNKCVDVIGGSPLNGTRIQQWSCNHSTWQQQWGFNRVDTLGGQPVFKISAKSTSYLGCLDALGGGSGGGTPIQQWDCAAGTNQQKWIQDYRGLTGGGEMLFRYRAYHAPSMCLDVQGASGDEGARLVLWSCHDGDNQLFVNVALGPR